MLPVHEPALLQLQEVLAGRFALERELGRGGMGIVLLARDLALDRPVAIKLLRPELAGHPEIRDRFLREARTAARLSHPNIIPVHAVEDHGELVFFIMAYVEGETLGDRVRRAGPLPAADAMRVMQEVAWALAYAHQLGVIHRDVKPDNILLERGTGRALVSDFGIALVASAPEAEGPVIGTVRYMSPEQQAGAALDGRSDLYSLGLAIRTALGDTPAAGGSLGPILDRCLAAAPGDRFPDGETLAAAVGTVRGHRLLTPPSVRRLLEVLRTFMLEVSSYVAIVAVLVAWAVALGDWGGPLFITASVYALMVMAGLLGLRSRHLVSAARDLLADGYQPADAWRALDREDALVPAEPTPSALRRVLEFGSGIAWVFAAGWWSSTSRGLIVDGLLFAALTLYPVVVLRGLLSRLLRPRHTGWWARLWKVFEWKIFGLARLTAQRTPPRLEEERTELALGDAARRLYDALPADVRREVAALPDLVERLEAQAARLRREGGEVTEPRKTALLALESLRLEMLRLAAGRGTAGELTRILAESRALSERVDRHLAARDEVETLLRPEARTPAT